MENYVYDLETEIKKILDSNCNKNIVLLSNDKTPIRFKKLDLISFKNEIYTILSPIDKLEGVKSDDYLILKIFDSEDGLNMAFPSSDRIKNKILKLHSKNIDSMIKNQHISKIHTNLNNENIYYCK